jgi:polyisoprenoid-binding protein YceI
VSETLTREEHDAKLEAAEARTDARFAGLRGEFAELRGEFGELRGELRALDGKLATLPTTFTVVTAVLGTGLAIFAGVLAALAFGGGLFGQGLSAYDIAHKAAADAVAEVRSTPPHP